MTKCKAPPSGPTEEDRAFFKQLLTFTPRALHDNVAEAAQKAMGRSLPGMEVRFRDLTISADVFVPKGGAQPRASYETVGNQIPRALATKCTIKSVKMRRQILHNLNGVFKPGTITLVLGQPGSGKSSFMKILSGRFPMNKTVTVDGAITYNGRKAKELAGLLPQCVAYVTQQDRHFPTLTVKETLQFAHACCGSALTKLEESFLQNGTAEDNLAALELARAVIRNMPELVIQQLGLQTCADTIVGDALLRGISGGQRKRVTTGEMQFGMKNVLLMDEISTGLDSASTFDIVNTHRSLAKRLNKTIVISLLQPSPEVFGLFDSVLIFNEGEVMYHGPRDEVQAYFQSLGFECPPRRDVADFLLDLGTDQQRQYEVKARDDVQHPRSAKEFAEVFRQSAVYMETLRELEQPLAEHLERDMNDYLTHRAPYFQSFLDSTQTLVKRQLVITGRNKSFIMGRVVMVLVMGLLYGTVFYQFDPSNVQVVMGMIFSAVLFLSLGQASQIPTFMDAREVFYKQRGANFYRTASYALSMSASQVPQAIGESVVFGSLVYWMCGFVADAGAFIMFLVLLFVTNLAFAAWFFLLAAVSPDVHIAKPVSMVTILFFVLFAGFIVSKDQLPSYVQWIYWVDPTAWCLRALAVNQFRASKLDVCVYDTVDYCSISGGLTMGEYYLKSYGVPSDKYWVPLGLLFMIAAYVLFMVISVLVLEFKRYEAHGNYSSVTQADEEEQVAELIRSSGRQLDTRGATSAKVIPVNHAGQGTSGKSSVTPVTLAFQDLWYSVPDPGNPKETIDLLRSVTGVATPGTMTALMGSSGAGKTTLMDVIAGRKTGGKIRGQILLNGHPATKLAIRRCTGYCEQMDIHSETATVREALTFSALLRQSSDVSLTKKLASVKECLDLLDLHPIADDIIHGRSTEQLKRITIGVELAAQPSIIFMDEPTSGLDARSAKTIMDGARKVANTGRTIVCTIHQPSSEVFQVFDRLLLLKRGGETVFFGDLGNECEHLIRYFEAVSGIERIAPGYNPATWMLECIGAGVKSSGSADAGDAGASAPANFVEIFRQSELKATLDAMLDQDGVSRPSPNLPPITFSNKYAAQHRTQMKLLVQRFWRMYWRMPSYNLVRIVIGVVLGVIFGIIYVDADYATFQGINGGAGMIFLTTLFVGMVSFNSVVPIAGEERASFYREQASQMYHPFWYFLGTTLAEIPYVFASAASFTVVFYPFVGFKGFETALFYWFNLSLLVLMQTYIGQFLSYAMPTTETALTMGVLLNSVYSLFMGFNPPAASIPSAYKWLYHLTPQRYALANLVAIVFGHCPTDGDGSQIGCQPLLHAPVTMGRLTVKQYVELVFDMHYDDVSKHLIIVGAAIVAFRVLALLSLWCLNHQKR